MYFWWNRACPGSSGLEQPGARSTSPLVCWWHWLSDYPLESVDLLGFRYFCMAGHTCSIHPVWHSICNPSGKVLFSYLRLYVRRTSIHYICKGYPSAHAQKRKWSANRKYCTWLSRLSTANIASRTLCGGGVGMMLCTRLDWSASAQIGGQGDRSVRFNSFTTFDFSHLCEVLKPTVGRTIAFLGPL